LSYITDFLGDIYTNLNWSSAKESFIMDEVCLKMGIPDESFITDGNQQLANILTRYYALRQAFNDSSFMYNVGVDGSQYSRATIAQNIKQMYDDAKREAGPFLITGTIPVDQFPIKDWNHDHDYRHDRYF
jgi:hypothetical protein